jgi:hypothetical protein
MATRTVRVSVAVIVGNSHFRHLKKSAIKTMKMRSGFGRLGESECALND